MWHSEFEYYYQLVCLNVLHFQFPQHINDLNRKLNLNSILCNAEGIYLQLLDAKETLSTPIKKMLAFIPPDDSESSDCESDIDNTKYEREKPSAPVDSTENGYETAISLNYLWDEVKELSTVLVYWNVAAVTLISSS